MVLTKECSKCGEEFQTRHEGLEGEGEYVQEHMDVIDNLCYHCACEKIGKKPVITKDGRICQR